MASKEHLNVIFSSLPTELQQDVINYAEMLLETKGYQAVEEEATRFYICPTCFLASHYQQECHGHLMMPCNADQEGCKPFMDSEGNIKSRAPRWFVTSVMAVDMN